MALMVSVSGIRGLVGRTLTPQVAMEFAQAYGTLLGEGKRVVLARDTRPSGPVFEAAALAGLLAAGCKVTQLGIAMTPTVGRTIRAGGYAGGMSITASHNPDEWNGLKFFDDLGVAPDPRLANEIAARRASGELHFSMGGWTAAERDETAGSAHVAAVLAAVEVDMKPLRGMKVVLDSVNGAGCLHSPEMLRALGCEVVHLHAEPHGRFSHRPEPTRENLGGLCEAVRKAGAAAGFAQDPDADRLAIVDERGKYIGEEYTLALSTWSVLSRRPGPVAANLSTSRMVDDIAAKHGVSVFRTPVGESHVARRMQAEGCVVGGEGNGGVIDPRICYVRDSLGAMSLVLQLLAQNGNTISKLVAELPAYASLKTKFELPRERIDAAVAAVEREFAEQKPNTSDGVRVDFPEGWVHVRASNTEPIMRVIAEARDMGSVERLVGAVQKAAGL